MASRVLNRMYSFQERVKLDMNWLANDQKIVNVAVKFKISRSFYFFPVFAIFQFPVSSSNCLLTMTTLQKKFFPKIEKQHFINYLSQMKSLGYFRILLRNMSASITQKNLLKIS
jgi:hypothetical protein